MWLRIRCLVAMASKGSAGKRARKCRPPVAGKQSPVHDSKKGREQSPVQRGAQDTKQGGVVEEPAQQGALVPMHAEQPGVGGQPARGAVDVQLPVPGVGSVAQAPLPAGSGGCSGGGQSSLELRRDHMAHNMQQLMDTVMAVKQRVGAGMGGAAGPVW